MSRPLRGAPLIAHRLKKYGGSMQGGLERLAKESRNEGKREGFQQGVQYALSELNILERIIGHKIGKK